MVNKLYSRVFVQRHAITFLPGRIVHSEDLCFAVTFLSKKPKIHYVPVRGYHYYQREGSLVNSKGTRMVFLSFVRVQRAIERLDLPAEAKPLVERRRREVVAFGSGCVEVTAQDLREAFPEVRSLGSSAPIWHRVFYRLSLRGFRWLVVSILVSVRALRTLRRKYGILRYAKKS